MLVGTILNKIYILNFELRLFALQSKHSKTLKFIFNTVSEATLDNLPLTAGHMPRHWSPATSHSTLYRECYGFGRVFFLSGGFYLSILPAFSRLLWGQQFNLKVSRTLCCGSKHNPGPTITVRYLTTI